ncbi:hypothetical protein [Nocardia transvalensis]|uniref:hypothetical protein n=1 Tax=Nocardia transvalensis TaxID=37333 RepID=UPI0018956362|nr:hypothetical protein [Nocardia transvalensis]MBF6332438.1 hypothetical protein [Nocardia transvalensis]
MTTSEPHTHSSAAPTDQGTEPASSLSPAELLTSITHAATAHTILHQASPPTFGHSEGSRPDPHNLQKIAETHGVDAIVERITQLHTDGYHHAASCLGWEFVHLGTGPAIVDPGFHGVCEPPTSMIICDAGALVSKNVHRKHLDVG